MNNLSYALSSILVIGGLIYLFYYRPKLEATKHALIFDNRVLGFIDGLYLAGISLGCTSFEMRRYVMDQLSKAHRLPDNQLLIEYTTAQGWRYCSHTGSNDHALFAILCIAQYAKECGNSEVIRWCESNMILASKAGIHY